MANRAKQPSDYKGPWNLNGDEDLSSWPNQTQTWYKTRRGLFLVTVDKENPSARWYSNSTSKHPGDAIIPHWTTWDGTFPSDIIFEMEVEVFSEKEIEAAMEIING